MSPWSTRTKRKKRRRTRNTSEGNSPTHTSSRPCFFEQTLLLPDDIKKEEISASMEHGVLNITLPKMTEVPATPKERFIDIK